MDEVRGISSSLYKNSQFGGDFKALFLMGFLLEFKFTRTNKAARELRGSVSSAHRLGATETTISDRNTHLSDLIAS